MHDYATCANMAAGFILAINVCPRPIPGDKSRRSMRYCRFEPLAELFYGARLEDELLATSLAL